MQHGDDNSESNHFLQAHLVPPCSLLPFLNNLHAHAPALYETNTDPVAYLSGEIWETEHLHLHFNLPSVSQPACVSAAAGKLLDACFLSTNDGTEIQITRLSESDEDEAPSS